MASSELTAFIHPARVEDFMRGLLSNRFPADFLERLVYEDMVRVPSGWAPPQGRCADIVVGIPLKPLGTKPQATHKVVAVKMARSSAWQLHERLEREVALLEREFDRRRAFGAPKRPPLITAAVVEQGRTPPKGARALHPRSRLYRWRFGPVRFIR